MKLTQYLIFEFHPYCNLGEMHQACPNRHPERYAHVDTSRALDDDTIVEVAARMHTDFGFRGLIGWHYYNEPLWCIVRMFHLMDAIRSRLPEARFVLWTNGTELPLDMYRKPADSWGGPFGEFAQIYVTDYGNADQEGLSRLMDANPCTQICQWPLDGRTTAQGQHSTKPCGRMFVEFVVDYHGNVHLCCHDWRGLGSPGNVFKDDLAVLVRRWQEIRASVAGARMTDDAPSVCLRCPMRHSGIGWEVVPEVVRDAKKYMAGLKKES